MRYPLGSRLHRLWNIQLKLCYALVAPPGRSVRMFGEIADDIEEMILEWQTELELEALVIERLTHVAREPLLEEHPVLDGEEHLVEGRMPLKQPEGSTHPAERL